ncbi:aminoglycoside phosphotransferase family protein [Nocardia sp. NPDC005366]|uniref:phosphotransferase family protein n=1 Tax=Nocardia sp. NPDC005366 TaxID=3156878 RepID=UPI0033B391C2
MTSQALVTMLGLGMAVKEAVRAGFDRTVSFRATLPLRVDEVTEQWLGDSLGLPPGVITSVRVVDHHSGTAARARVAVKSESADIPPHLFVKLPPRNYLQHVLMNIFRLGTREVLAYNALGEDPPVRVPRCYAAKSDELRKRNVLVLEDLSETAEFRTVIDTVTGAEAEAVVDALADLHGRFWGTDRFAADLRPLAQRSAAEIRIGDIIRRQFLAEITGHTSDLISEETKKQCRVFYERSADIDAFWASQPQTLIHGDPHLGNLFFEGATPGFLDWQIATAGAGIRDIAYFATASVAPELLRTIERDLVARYTAALTAAGIDVDGERMWTLYRAAVTEFFLAAVCTAEAGERMQPLDVSRVGVERAVASVSVHDSFTVLADLIDGKSG